MKVRDLPDDWRQWLADRGWLDDLDPELPVWLYEWHEDIDHDEWRDEPHLAIKDRGSPIPDVLAWPVHVDGWADATAIGWDGINQLINEGRRK